MSLIQKKNAGSKPLQQLLTCMEELAKNIQDSFTQMTQNMKLFQGKINQIRINHFQQPQSKTPKNLIISKKKETKMKKQVSEQVLDQIKQIQLCQSQFFNQTDKKESDIPIVTIDEDMDFNKKTNDFFLPTLDFQFNEQMFQENNECYLDPLWKEFYDIQSIRIKKADPIATPLDIRKFVQIKWNQMTKTQRTNFIENEKNKKENATIKTIKKAASICKPEAQNIGSRFQSFLTKKSNKSGPVTSCLNYCGENLKNEQQKKPKVSINQLVEAIEKSKEEKQDKDEQKSELKLKRIFQNFQL